MLKRPNSNLKIRACVHSDYTPHPSRSRTTIATLARLTASATRLCLERRSWAEFDGEEMDPRLPMLAPGVGVGGGGCTLPLKAPLEASEDDEEGGVGRPPGVILRVC